MRQALELLSDEPAAAAGQAAASSDGPVTSSVAADAPGAVSTVGRDDEADTTPLPVILPGVIAVPRPEAASATRGPFEPARLAPPASPAGPAPADTAAPAPADASGPAPADTAAPALAEAAQPAGAEPAETLPAAAAEKLDQIKDLLITAEAIGEANLDRHFDQVSQRQRELIREFFETAKPAQPEA